MVGVAAGHEADGQAGLVQPCAVVPADGTDPDHGVAAHLRHGTGVFPYDAGMDDRLYFRQLLAGRDFARSDQFARQMVNFVYLIGDRETGETLVVDPAYDVGGLLDIVAADDMNLVGALGHPLPPRPRRRRRWRAWPSKGVRELLDRAPVPVHVQADEAGLVHPRDRCR